MNEKYLKNVVGGFWALDFTISIVATLGTFILGHNRQEPIKEIKEEEFVIVQK